MTRISHHIFLLLTLAIVLSPLYAREDGKTESVNHAFDAIEAAILAGNVKELTPYFGRQLNLNLRSVKGGYYSSNQSYYILQNFFSSRKIFAFKFTSRKPDDPIPYATGGGSSRMKGVNEILQVYVSLTEVDHRWVISEFNIY